MTDQPTDARFILVGSSFFNVLDLGPQGDPDRRVVLVENFIHDGVPNRKPRVGHISARSLEAEIAGGRAASFYLPAADEAAPTKICATDIAASNLKARKRKSKPTLQKMLRSGLAFKASDLGRTRPPSRNARKYGADTADYADA